MFPISSACRRKAVKRRPRVATHRTKVSRRECLIRPSITSTCRNNEHGCSLLPLSLLGRGEELRARLCEGSLGLGEVRIWIARLPLQPHRLGQEFHEGGCFCACS